MGGYKKTPPPAFPQPARKEKMLYNPKFATDTESTKHGEIGEKRNTKIHKKWHTKRLQILLNPKFKSTEQTEKMWKMYTRFSA